MYQKHLNLWHAYDALESPHERSLPVFHSTINLVQGVAREHLLSYYSGCLRQAHQNQWLSGLQDIFLSRRSFLILHYYHHAIEECLPR